MNFANRRLFPGLSGWRRLLLFGSVWTILGVFQATRLYFIYNYSGSAISWGQALVWAVSEWYLWGLFSLIIVRIVFAAPITRKNWISRVGLHFVAAIAISTALLFCYTFVYLGTSDWFYHEVGASVSGFSDTFRSLALGKIHYEIFTYFLIVVVAYALVYAGELREEQLRRVRTEGELTRARLETLRGQLQPHFLFNTLNAISALVHSDPARAENMIVRLSELLRTSLQDDGIELIPLSAELDFTRKYLDIQQMRFQSRLKVTYEIDEKSLEALVPGLLLQPVVENAVRHGIATRAEGGTISISSVLQDNSLILEVRDDGPGLQGATGDTGVGLQNVNRRLRELYDDNFEFDLVTPEHAVLIARIALPLETESSLPRTGETP